MIRHCERSEAIHLDPKNRWIAASRVALLAMTLLVTACASDFEPADKVATVDADTGYAVPPHPCPDWSHNATVNYDNSVHSNYGCAVNNNIAVQLADPWDLHQGIGSDTGNTDMSIRTIELYRSGDIPVPLQPMQGEGLSSQ